MALARLFSCCRQERRNRGVELGVLVGWRRAAMGGVTFLEGGVDQFLTAAPTAYQPVGCAGWQNLWANDTPWLEGLPICGYDLYRQPAKIDKANTQKAGCLDPY